ncbi:formate dehydrogenase subunit gamma [Bordetella sp. 2513F-2]
MHTPPAPAESAARAGTRHEPASPAMAEVARIVDALRHEPGALLPILHAVQDALGCIPPDTVPAIAAGLNLSRAEVHGVITFYPHFRTAPAPAHTLALCRAEACQAMGGEQLAAHARQRLSCDFHGTSGDGAFLLEPVYCLGLCAQSPALMLDGRPHARVTPERLDRLLERAQGGTP